MVDVKRSPSWTLKNAKLCILLLLILTVIAFLASNVAQRTKNSSNPMLNVVKIPGQQRKTWTFFSASSIALGNAPARNESFVNKRQNFSKAVEEFEFSETFRAFVATDYVNSNNVTEYLAALRDYLLAFRSPMIREDPIQYSWPETEEEKQRYKASMSNTSGTVGRSTKRIVWYNPPSHFPRQNAKQTFGHCPVKDCVFSFWYKKDHAQADAVMFFGGPGKTVPPRDHDKQVYIFHAMESPLIAGPNNGKTAWNSVYNWTWTYRTDSDIFEPVNYLRRSRIIPSHSELLAIMHRKTKAVAWMVSNCNAQSKRGKYVKRLQKIIHVDIYGRCGTLTCKSKDPKCNRILNDYMFYLSFENAMCVDYITEKYYKTYYKDLHVLSVVRGGANYSRFFPDGTFIDAEAFPSPEALGWYLLRLAKDEARYVDMLWRRAHFVHLEHGIINSFCQVCYLLHHLDRYSKSYQDMYSWYYKDKCRSPRPFR